MHNLEMSDEEVMALYDFLRSDDAFYAANRIQVDFVVNRLAPIVKELRGE